MSRDAGNIQSVDGGYLVPGVAFVQHAPAPAPKDGDGVRRRVAYQPRAYLAECRQHAVPGIVDLRYGSDGGPFTPRANLERTCIGTTYQTQIRAQRND